MIAEAVELLETQPPGPELVGAYAYLAGQPRAHWPRTGRRSWPPSGRSRSPPSSACPSRHSRSTGAASPALHLGDADGLDDVRRALELALEQGLGRETAVIHDNLAGVVWRPTRGHRPHSTPSREAIDFCERRGIAEFALNSAPPA